MEVEEVSAKATGNNQATGATVVEVTEVGMVVEVHQERVLSLKHHPALRVHRELGARMQITAHNTLPTTADKTHMQPTVAIKAIWHTLHITNSKLHSSKVHRGLLQDHQVRRRLLHRPVAHHLEQVVVSML